MAAIDPAYVSPSARLWDNLVATCSYCGWLKKFVFSNGMKLKVGDPLPRGEDPNFDTCMRCKRKSLKVSQVPSTLRQTQPVGFWKVPTV